MKKASIKDVALAAKVSIATVSYVVNGKNLDRISEATIKKVLQWVNILGYFPSETARNLQRSETKNIAFISSNKLCYLQKIEIMNFLEFFSLYANKENYKVLYIYQDSPDIIKNCDAIVCFNLTKEDFYALGDINTIPMIAVNLNLNDSLFYQINRDYELIYKKASEFFNDEFTLFAISPQAIEEKLVIERVFKNTLFVDRLEDIVSLIDANKHKNILVYESSIKNVFEALYPNAIVYYYSLKTPESFRKIMECIKWAIQRTEGKEHDIKI